MEKEIEKVEITFSDGTQETYTKDVLVVALNGGGVACRGFFKCPLSDAVKVAMTMVMEAGRIFGQSAEREEGGVNEMRLEEGGNNFRDFIDSL